MAGDTHPEKFSLVNRLRRRIKTEGPISFHDWMQAALYDPADGYYMRKDLVRQGRAGDYRTAPETSVLFATTFAHYFLELYLELGQPSHWTIVEAGGGSGAFAHGVLSTFQSHAPNIYAGTCYVIDELSPAGRSAAAAKLEPFSDRVEFKRLGDIDAPLDHAILFSNELIDAFPVHRVIGRRGRLQELYVDLNQSGDFVWIEGELTPRVAAYCEQIDLRLAETQIHEINIDSEEYFSAAAKLVRNGYLITVDYGASRHELLDDPARFAGTLRAFNRHHLIDDPLADAGAQDLTTTIDWTQVREIAARCGFAEVCCERLDRFLLNQGLLSELAYLTGAQMHAADMVALQLGAREMIRPDGLAASFHVLVHRISRADLE